MSAAELAVSETEAQLQWESDQHIFTLGLEIELIVNTWKKSIYEDIRRILEAGFSEQLNLPGVNYPIQPTVDIGVFHYSINSKGEKVFQKLWSQNKRHFYITRENGIDGLDLYSQTPVEIVTPVMRRHSSNWIISGMLRALSSSGLNIVFNRYCGLHIHIGIRGGFSLCQLKRISKAVLLFESQMDTFHTPERRTEHKYIGSNRAFVFSGQPYDENDEILKSLLLLAVFSQIDATEDIRCFMNGTRTSEKNFKYNFQSLTTYGTIEFRQAAATLDENKVLAWRDVVVAFVSAAMKTGDACFLKWAKEEYCGVDQGRLLEFLKSGGWEGDDSSFFGASH